MTDKLRPNWLISLKKYSLYHVFRFYTSSKAQQDKHYEYSNYSNFVARKLLFAEAENTTVRWTRGYK